VQKIESLENFNSLRLLDLSTNKLDNIDGISMVQSLEELWIDYNLLNEEFEIEDIKNLMNLKNLRLNYNQLNKNAEIKDIVHRLVPKLTEFNGEILEHKYT